MASECCVMSSLIFAVRYVSAAFLIELGRDILPMTRRYTSFEKMRLCITLLQTWRSNGFPSATAAFNGQFDPSSPRYYGCVNDETGSMVSMERTLVRMLAPRENPTPK